MKTKKKFHQGLFKPKNPSKYVGNVANIVYRSSWEKQFMSFADSNPQIVKWCSEELVIQYLSPVDKNIHRYFPDFLMLVRTDSGQLKRYVVEIKPNKERFPPTGTRKTKQLLEATKTYAVNQAKWAAATIWADKHGMGFIVLDEYDLGIKKKPKQ